MKKIILAGWIPSRNGNKDDGGERFGGSVVLREVAQCANGDLAVKFPEEVIPATGIQLANQWIDSDNSMMQNNEIRIDGSGSIGGAFMKAIPNNCRITMEVEPLGNNDEYGLFVRCNEKAAGGYKLSLSTNLQTARLHNTQIEAVKGLDKKLTIDIVMKDDIIDVFIDNRRCMVNRLPEKKGEYVWLYAKQGSVKIKKYKGVTSAVIH